jgi:menaquinol-cytochrome c reductase iron-sulfur subunit
MLRRTFLKSATLTVNALIAAGLAIPGLRYLLHPLRRSGGGSAFVPVTPLESLPVGVPTRLTVTAEQRDSFTKYSKKPIGGVWLVREDGPSGPVVRCWQVICPHLGCGVDFIRERSAFSCPCHASEFDLEGRRKFGPSPRDLDSLECRVVEAPSAGRAMVEVNYQRFRTGLPDKVVMT